MKKFAFMLVFCLCSVVLFSCSGKGTSEGYTKQELYGVSRKSTGAKKLVEDGDALRHGMTGPDLSGKKYVNGGSTSEGDMVYIYKKSEDEYFLFKCSPDQSSLSAAQEAKKWLKNHFDE